MDMKIRMQQFFNPTDEKGGFQFLIRHEKENFCTIKEEEKEEDDFSSSNLASEVKSKRKN
jgi:hypothetical protein